MPKHSADKNILKIQNVRQRLFTAIYFAQTDIIARYKRSTLGPFWLVLGIGIGVLGLAIVWAELLNVHSNKFVPHIALGLIIWQTLSAAITEGTTNFITAAGIINNIRVPFYFFTLTLILRTLITLAHSLVIIVIIILIFPDSFYFTPIRLLWWALGLLLMILNLAWMTHLIAYMGARFRDIQPLVLSVMPLLFFLTPVLYEASRLGDAKFMVYLNPFFYLIEIVRAPLIEPQITPQLYLISGVALIIGLSGTYMISRKIAPTASLWI